MQQCSAAGVLLPVTPQLRQTVPGREALLLLRRVCSICKPHAHCPCTSAPVALLPAGLRGQQSSGAMQETCCTHQLLFSRAVHLYCTWRPTLMHAHRVLRLADPARVTQVSVLSYGAWVTFGQQLSTADAKCVSLSVSHSCSSLSLSPHVFSPLLFHPFLLSPFFSFFSSLSLLPSFLPFFHPISLIPSLFLSLSLSPLSSPLLSSPLFPFLSPLSLPLPSFSSFSLSLFVQERERGRREREGFVLNISYRIGGSMFMIKVVRKHMILRAGSSCSSALMLASTSCAPAPRSCYCGLHLPAKLDLSCVQRQC